MKSPEFNGLTQNESKPILATELLEAGVLSDSDKMILKNRFGFNSEYDFVSRFLNGYQEKLKRGSADFYNKLSQKQKLSFIKGSVSLNNYEMALVNILFEISDKIVRAIRNKDAQEEEKKTSKIVSDNMILDAHAKQLEEYDRTGDDRYL